MKRLLALLCGAAVSVPAMAADWQLLSVNEGSTLYYDRSSVVRQKGSARMWKLTDFSEIRFVGPKPFISSVDLWEFDCSGKRSRMLSGTAYSGRMGGGAVIFAADYSDADWSHVVPDSTGELALVVACGKK